MSMISAQIDELSELAGDGSMEWVTGPIRASVLRDAADTIWQLRDDLQRANAENTTLRQQLADVTESMGRVEERCAKLREYIERKQHLQDFARLVDENSKLRKLAEKAWKTAERLCQAFDGPCSADGVTIYDPCPLAERDEECVYGSLQRDLRELGVEVDDG